MDQFEGSKSFGHNQQQLFRPFDAPKCAGLCSAADHQSDQSRRSIVSSEISSSAARGHKWPSVNIVIIALFVTAPLILFAAMLLFYHFVQYV
ncbi:hypothetical protein niasHS_001595 [Heterodera schachtii]|uniref:Uncharacterized protein n=1 Tax=Heterodera schachtii TaxID=97005 RepID=A0ABD2KDW4_HETSC